MDNILNKRMKECYDITGEVVVKYDELYDVMIEYALEDSLVYENYISGVRDLVFKEYNAYSTLSLSDINMCLKFLEKIDCESSVIDSRFKRKLEVLRDTYMGTKVTGIELKLDIIPNNMEFNLFVSLTSLIDIEMMKRVRKILDEVTAENYSDLLFIKSLFKKFNSTLFSQTFGNNLTEIIVLSSNMDVNNIPNIDIDNLIDIINNRLGLANDSYFKPVDATIIELAKITVNRLVYEGYDNNPRQVFSNMAFITRLELLISYMNKDCLMDLLVYCENFKDINSFGVDKVISLIRNKIK